MATGIGTAASQPPPPVPARRRMGTANLEAATDPDSNANPIGRSRCATVPVTYAAGFEQAPRPAAGTATAGCRRVQLDDIPAVRSQGARCSATSGEEERRANSGSWQRPRKAPPVPSSPPAGPWSPGQRPRRHADLPALPQVRTGDRGTAEAAGRGGGSGSCEGHSAHGEQAGLRARFLLRPPAAKQSVTSLPISRAQS